MRIWRRLLVVLALAMVVVAGLLSASGDAQALNTQDILKKWTFVGFRTCAQSNINSPLSTEQSGSVADAVMKAEGTVNLPSYGFGGVSGTSINCKENFLGSGGMTGVINYGGISGSTQWSDATGTKSILEGKLKYKFKAKGEKYFTLTATRSTENTMVDGFGERTYQGPTVTTRSGRITQDGDTYKLGSRDMEAIKLSISGKNLVIEKGGLPPQCNWTQPRGVDSVSISFEGKDIDAFAGEIVNKMNGQKWAYTCNNGTTSGTNYSTSEYSFTKEVVDAGQKGEYKWENKTDDAIKEMSGVKADELVLDKNQQYVLYKYYVEKAAATEGGSINCEEEQTGSNWTVLEKWRTGGEFKKCWVSFNGRSPGDITVYTIGSGPKIQRITLATVINWLNNVNTDELTDVDMVTNGDATDSGGSADVTCASSGAAGSLGWIVCPIMDWLGGAAQDLYNGVVKDSLQVEPELFTGGNGGTKQGWETFRNIANVVFIILFMVVIFSQLTGVGIDNYGIKKILPKLIISAILINLSYWICIVFVDLSNILGNSFQALFNGLAAGLNPSSTVVGSGAFESAGATIVSVIIIGIIVAGAGVAIALNPAILLAMVVGAIGVVISILFLFVLLSVREAAIVVLVVISPLAVVCYMLPNTKSMFDKWLKFFEGLLLVYPICGLLIGGGNYVSRLLLASGVGDGGIFSAVTAMIIGIVPIFFIPTVLKSSFAAMGTVGAKLAGMGKGASGWATGKMRDSNAYKNAQERGLERRTRIRGGIDKNGVPVTGGRRAVASFLSGGKRGRQRSALQYQKMVADRGSLEAADAPEFMTATQTANVMKELNATGAINEMGKMNTDANGNYIGGGGSGLTGGLYSALMSGNKAQIRAYTDALSAKGEDGRNAVKAAYNAAVGDGMSGESAKAFADNIMANHAADYKNNNRAMFAVAQGINAASDQDRASAVQTTGQYLANGGQEALASKVTSNTIGNTDDTAFAETFSPDANGDLMPANLRGDDEGSRKAREAIGATAYAALNDQNANIKADRRAALEKLVAESGYKPAPQDVNANITNDILDVREAGHVADPQGNTYKVHRNINGGVSDEGGFEIDPTQFNAR